MKVCDAPLHQLRNNGGGFVAFAATKGMVEPHAPTVEEWVEWVGENMSEHKLWTIMLGRYGGDKEISIIATELVDKPDTTIGGFSLAALTVGAEAIMTGRKEEVLYAAVGYARMYLT
jgi:hypothetical protein